MGDYVMRQMADGYTWMQYVPSPWVTLSFWLNVATWTLGIIAVGCFVAGLILK